MNSVARVPTGFSAQPFPAPELTDLQAVSAVQAGDREMFEVIVRRYNTQLYRVGMAYLRDHAQTEDAMQNAYLKAFTHLSQFKGAAAFSTWLTRIMINECLMLLRQRSRFPSDSLNDERKPVGDRLLAPPVIDPLHRDEMRAMLEQVLVSLPRTHRAVYLMREVQHLTTAQTAACLGISQNNVKICLHRAREELKSRWLKSATALELFDYPAPFCGPMTARVMRRIAEL